MALRPEVAASDGATEIQHGEGGEAERPGELRSPGGGLQRHRCIVAGERRQGGVPVGEINRSQVENEFGIHDLEDLIPRISSQTHCVEWLRVLHGSG